MPLDESAVNIPFSRTRAKTNPEVHGASQQICISMTAPGLGCVKTHDFGTFRRA
jgi:hypothetical protein